MLVLLESMGVLILRHRYLSTNYLLAIWGLNVLTLCCRKTVIILRW